MRANIDKAMIKVLAGGAVTLLLVATATVTMAQAFARDTLLV